MTENSISNILNLASGNTSAYGAASFSSSFTDTVTVPNGINVTITPNTQLTIASGGTLDLKNSTIISGTNNINVQDPSSVTQPCKVLVHNYVNAECTVCGASGHRDPSTSPALPANPITNIPESPK